MSGSLVPRGGSGVSVHRGGSSSSLPRATSRALQAIDQRTIVRVGELHAEATVEVEKVDQVDRLVDKAMMSHAFLHARANALAGNDPLLGDELRFFTDMSRLAKGELIADFVDRVRGF